jgi:hypothetical protein
MQTISDSEWKNLVHLKDEITKNPSAICSKDMELFTELFVKSLANKGDYPLQVFPKTNVEK